jgi:ribonuclease D
MKYLTKISKEEINKLPVATFTGKITLVDESSKVEPSIAELRKNDIVGIDTETKPSFIKGVSHKVSLLQIATPEQCFLFRLNRIGFPKVLADFLADKNITKVGLSLHDDLRKLRKRHHFKPENFIDIQSIVKNYGIMELSLQKIYAIIFGKKILKSQRLSNWEKPQLTDKQLQYAAIDAWASLQIYLQLTKEEPLAKKEIEKLVLENSPAKNRAK